MSLYENLVSIAPFLITMPHRPCAFRGIGAEGMKGMI